MLNIEPTYMLTIEPSYRCNMNCDFCYNSSIIDNENITQTIDFTKVFFSEVCKEIDKLNVDKKSTFVLNVLGGEVLADFWEPSYLDNFYTFAKNISDYCMKANRTLVIIFNTNLVHEKTSRWLTLFSKLSEFSDVKINTSYDIYGRFKTKYQFETFKRNLTIYLKYIKVINVVKTKELLRILVYRNYKNPLEEELCYYFDSMYDQFKDRLLIDEYVCNSEEYKYLQCTNHENFLINRYLVTNYKNLNLYNFSINKKNRCSFTPGLILDPDCKRLPDCIFASVGDKFIKDIPKTAKNIQEKLTVIHNMAANKLGCYTCKYYGSCPSACPMSMATIHKEEYEECFIKQTLDYIEENNIYD